MTAYKNVSPDLLQDGGYTISDDLEIRPTNYIHLASNSLVIYYLHCTYTQFACSLELKLDLDTERGN